MMMLIVATNITDLHKGPSFLEEMLTQVVNGQSVEVLEETEKWCRVREEGGYEGWVYRGYLAEGEKPEATHITQTPLELVDKPFGELVGKICIGTRIRVVATEKDWARVSGCGMRPQGWVYSPSLRSLSALPARTAARHVVVQTAQEMTGTYYLWGGNSEWGTDCSGLVMMTHRLAGYTVPRDAWMQERDAKKVETAQVGDLFFFWNEARTKIGHVGICTGGWNMIHSSRARNGVYEEDIMANPNLKAAYAGAGTFLR